jgi:hypothetical protein
VAAAAVLDQAAQLRQRLELETVDQAARRQSPVYQPRMQPVAVAPLVSVWQVIAQVGPSTAASVGQATSGA